ncbi:cupin domain-containing protein [Staphylococcus sp. IVB6181]|uniref:cupin domain-containing protein n=1 Tax=Staphylococcus sp. IVB6181 TaxID=2929481 RepID=UPI0021D2BE1A|nr:cupin domain-containing protein [Staphylococcus sp. IVB6181]UXV35354.1 cupin domain-containing protein [Staphylococcus sp. IVB6181]
MTQFNQNRPEPIRGNKGATDNGPRNIERDLQNPDMIVPPETDGGTLDNMKFSFSDVHVRLEEGGWSREVTKRELPISEPIASVNMRLTPGGVRELHWHKEAEWAIVLNGAVRVTSVDQDGKVWIDIVRKNELWYFPAGIPHSLKGMEDGAEFLLVFDDGGFSENSTFSITDWFSSTPNDVLAKNFGVPPESFEGFPKGETYIYQGEQPSKEEEENILKAVEQVPNPFTFKLKDEVEPIQTSGGQVWIADSNNFKASTTVTGALVEVEPGGMREMHWHPNASEWQYYIQGQARMTVFAAESHARTFNYRAGDVGYVPFAMGHYVENIGDEPLVFLEMFKSDHFADISLNQWMANTPKDLLKEHLTLDDDFINNHLSHDKHPNVKHDEQ